MSGAPCADALVSGLADAVMREIAVLLERLAETGESGAIDLRSLPMTEADRAQLKERLGTGEVSARLDVVGVSTVEETAYPGLWWIRHEGADGRVANEQIEATWVPAILAAHPDDVAEGRARLEEALRAEAATREQEDAT